MEKDRRRLRLKSLRERRDGSRNWEMVEVLVMGSAGRRAGVVRGREATGRLGRALQAASMRRGVVDRQKELSCCHSGLAR